MPSKLSKYFRGVGAKRLSEVEVSPDKSNQHELNGVSAFKEIFGSERIRFEGRFIYFNEQDELTFEDNGNLLWYDAREAHATRTEFRLYYTSNSVMDAARHGDLVILAKAGDNSLLVAVAPADTTIEKQLLLLFGLQEVESKLVVRDFLNEDVDVGFAENYIIESLGIEIEEDQEVDLEYLLRKFDGRFPSSSEFSSFARSQVTNALPVEAPDETIILWLEREELYFKTLERHFVSERIAKGFGNGDDPVESFIRFSLSVHNRRKARAGYAFENHLNCLFLENGLLFTKGGKTERNNTPDFIFPGIKYYSDDNFHTQLLTMLGVKTTAKDRWRQVLSEADRISPKHLATLEPAISRNQTEEMAAQNVQLVVPKAILKTYSEGQRVSIQTLSDFIGIVQQKQRLPNS